MGIEELVQRKASEKLLNLLVTTLMKVMMAAAQKIDHQKMVSIKKIFDDCEKGKTYDKHQSKRSNETSEVSSLSSLNGEKDVQSL
ncbi:hypothetical protein DAPPUDRAFT_330817 [Daphnia pulex]|uniref:Uncharacterized protein n=1 Tax=Daphnia pulex TaxID=6669 RepID=E9HKQ5_DAPPU|nr:hypothetical protein DAPPUDRAFT_330817 [Daphnia pulex]|eukprot:EFX67677.1 hypothetical protein DAPPUDRAFT_330817 [Daphnia pulex]